MKLFKIFFDIQVYCNGVYKYYPSSITVMGENKEDAINQFKNNVKFTPQIMEVSQINLSKNE